MNKSTRFEYAFKQLLEDIRCLAEDEKIDLNSPHSRGRASGIHAVLLQIDASLISNDIDPSEVGFSDFNAGLWFNGEA